MTRWKKYGRVEEKNLYRTELVNIPYVTATYYNECWRDEGVILLAPRLQFGLVALLL
jgi:hypothetical protein